MARHLMPESFETLFETAGMDNWACLGATTDRSVRVWVRSQVGAALPVMLRDGNEILTEATLEPDVSHDGIATVDVSLDKAHPGRRLTVEVGDHRREVTLAPEDGRPAPFSFVFGSCNQPFVRGETGAEEGVAGRIFGPLQEVARRENAAFSLLVGDQAYADGVEGLGVPDWVRNHPEADDATILAAYRQVYRAYLSHTGFQELLELMPSYMVWDDHEIFDSWGSHEEVMDVDRRLFQAARQTYAEYEHTHNPGATLDAQGPFQYSFWYGNTGFFVFDLRSERDYNLGSLVGPAQWQAFEAFLRQAADREAASIFVVTTIPVVHFSSALVRLLDSVPSRKASLIRERWDADNLRHHRKRLLDLLFDWQASGEHRKAVLLSGDVHAAAAFRVESRSGPGTLSQWTSSALCTSTGIPHTIANRVGTRFVNLGDDLCRSHLLGLEPENNFGLVHVIPRDGGGHDIDLTISKYDAGNERLKTAFVDRI